MEQKLKQHIYELKDEFKIFHLLSNEELEQIIPYFEILNCPSGKTLFNEGDPGDFIGFVMSGKLEVKKHTEFKGKEIVLALMEKGTFVGELSLFDMQPRSSTVLAVKDSELVILGRENFESILQKYPQAGIKILKGINRILSIRLRKAVERLSAIF